MMIRRTCSVVNRAGSLRCFSLFSDGERNGSESEMGAESPHLCKEASLYVHVSGCLHAQINRLNLGHNFCPDVTVFLHSQWPYCLRRCSYCNFNKYISRTDNNHIMTECLQRETETLLHLSQVSRYEDLLDPST